MEFIVQQNHDKDRLELITHWGKHPIFVDFVSDKMVYRRQALHSQKDLLSRACGKYTTVMDVTAGFGVDGFLLAAMGYRVHMIERSEIMGALIKDAIKRGLQDEATAKIITKQLTFTLADAKSILKALAPSEYPEVIYMDPMFSDRKKSALNSVKMRVLHALVGSDTNDTDASALFANALRVAKKRVVVKRSKRAKYLLEAKPDFCISGKTHRFDVYLSKTNAAND